MAKKDSLEKKYKIGYTTGVFDMFHIGHLNLLKRAKEHCDYLIVGVTSDELCYERKNKYPIVNFENRKKIIQSITYVDKVVKQNNMDKFTFVKNNKVDVVFVGSDWRGTKAWKKYEEEFAKINCKVKYLRYTKGISSTSLRDKLDHQIVHYKSKNNRTNLNAQRISNDIMQKNTIKAVALSDGTSYNISNFVSNNIMSKDKIVAHARSNRKENNTFEKSVYARSNSNIANGNIKNKSIISISRNRLNSK